MQLHCKQDIGCAQEYLIKSLQKFNAICITYNNNIIAVEKLIYTVLSQLQMCFPLNKNEIFKYNTNWYSCIYQRSTCFVFIGHVKILLWERSIVVTKQLQWTWPYKTEIFTVDVIKIIVILPSDRSNINSWPLSFLQ